MPMPAAPHALCHVFLTGRCWCLVRLEPRGSVETTHMKPLDRVRFGQVETAQAANVALGQAQHLLPPGTANLPAL